MFSKCLLKAEESDFFDDSNHILILFSQIFNPVRSLKSKEADYLHPNI